MNVAAMFGMTIEEFLLVITILTSLNFMMILYTIWLRKKIREAGKSIEENHKKTLDLADTIYSAAQLAHYKKMKNYDKLTSKNDWYIFGLVNLSLVNKNRQVDDKLNILESFEVVGALWCKRPEDVGSDYMIVLDGLTNK